MYRNPINKSDSTEFLTFLEHFESLYVNIKKENPYLILFSGVFNGSCQNWWPEGDSNSEGVAIYYLTSKFGLSQLVSEPTNFQDNSAPSSIDLIFCDQPNIVTHSGTHTSLDHLCKHQLTYFKINHPTPPYVRKTWDYSKAY